MIICKDDFKNILFRLMFTRSCLRPTLLDRHNFIFISINFLCYDFKTRDLNFKTSITMQIKGN